MRKTLEDCNWHIVNTIARSFHYYIFILLLPTKHLKVYLMSPSSRLHYGTDMFMWFFFHVLLHAAPSPPSLISFADVTNTSLAITWKGPPDWTDYDDFELQWFPRDAITVFNPYSNRKSEGRIVYGLRPGRSYQFSVKTISGDSWKTYSKPVSGSVRTSMTCFTTLGSQMEWGGSMCFDFLLERGLV